MAIELITGRYGTAHIGSEDVRAYQAYTAGSGRYVLHGGGASIQSANDIHVNPAEILIDGAHVRITGTGEDVTIDNGASSYKRVDIIALHYKMTGDGDTAVESVTLDVVKGTPADSDPQDPNMPATGNILDNVSETYVPYVRVLIDGLTPQTPTVLLPDYVNPSDLAGDGDQVNPSLLVNLASTAADGVYKESPRPGVTGTLPVSHGGTGATAAKDAIQNLAYLGSNITGGTANDTRRFWQDKGTGFAFFSATGQINDQPEQHGFIINIVQGYEVRQLWLNQPNGDILNRGGNGTSALLSSWVRMHDDNNAKLAAYPVGAVYISYVSTSPASLFGGSWTAITGRFPYFNAGTSTGGSNTHTLSKNEIPSHVHDSPRPQTVNSYNNGGGVYGSALTGAWAIGGQYGVILYTGGTGGGAAHNNMPAYQTLYAWRRTA